jgi:hypothetical protein
MYREQTAAQNRPVASRQWLLFDAPHQPEYRQGLTAAIVLLLVVTWLGARGLNADAFWYDEVWSLYYAGGAEFGPITPAESVLRVVDQLAHEKNPPGYYVLLNLWGKAAGWSELAGRTLSLLVGVLSVAVTYRLGVDVGRGSGRQARQLIGLGAAAAVGGSAFFLYYVHEMRCYALVVLCAVFLLWAYWRVLHAAKPSFSLQLAFVVGIGAALYLYYMTALVLGAIGLYHLLVAPKSRYWWWVTGLLVAGGALFLPWLIPLVMATIRAGNRGQVSLTPPEMLTNLLYVFGNGGVLLLGLIVIYAISARGRHVAYIGFAAGGGILLAAILNTVYPVVTTLRYIIVLWPALALVIGVGVERLWRKGIWAGWILGLWVAAGAWNTIDPSFNRTLNEVIMPWREFRAELMQEGQPSDVVVFHVPDFNWFRDLEMQHYMDGLPQRYSLLENIPGLEAEDEYYQNALTFVEDASCLWLGVDRSYTPTFRLSEFERILAQDYSHCLTAWDESDMSMDLYSRLPESLGAIPLHFGDGIGTQVVAPAHLLPDRTLSLMLGWWVGENVPPNTYSVGLHILDLNNNLVAQADYGLPASGYHCLPTAITVPPGDLTLMALVYNWQTGEKLPAVSIEDDLDGERIPIATVVVQ